MVESAEYMCSNLVIEDSFQADFVVLERSSYFEYSFLGIEGN